MDNLITELTEVGIIKYGDFILKSGQRSKIYFDFKGLINYPRLVRELCEKIVPHIIHGSVCLAGVPLGAIPYATICSDITNIPQVLIRDQPKLYGLQKQIEGYIPGTNVILIEDVITTGKSVLDSINILESNNIKVIKVICILDREQGGVTNITNMGYKVKCIYKISDFLVQKAKL